MKCSNICAKLWIIDAQCQLKIKPKTTHVQIYCADEAKLAVYHDRLRVEEATVKSINIDTGA